MQLLNNSANALNNTINSTNIVGASAGIGTVVGGVVGSVVPGVGTAVGAMVGGSIGGLVGGITNSFIPSYSTIRGNNASINFTVLNRKPYWLEYHCPTKEELIKLDAIYKYYQGHAYVKDDLHYNSSIGLKYFNQINAIFNKGVHILQ